MKTGDKYIYCVMSKAGHFMSITFNPSKDTKIGINNPTLHMKKLRSQTH